MKPLILIITLLIGALGVSAQCGGSSEMVGRFNQITPAERHALWVDHLNDLKVGATAEQIEFIDELLNQLTPNHYNGQSQLNVNYLKLFALFPDPSVFAQLGTDQINDLIALTPNYTEDPLRYTCNCSVFSDWCKWRIRGGDDRCIGDLLGCEWVWSGCGTLWTYTCNGMCGG